MNRYIAQGVATDATLGKRVLLLSDELAAFDEVVRWSPRDYLAAAQRSPRGGRVVMQGGGTVTIVKLSRNSSLRQDMRGRQYDIAVIDRPDATDDLAHELRSTGVVEVIRP